MTNYFVVTMIAVPLLILALALILYKPKLKNSLRWVTDCLLLLTAISVICLLMADPLTFDIFTLPLTYTASIPLGVSAVIVAFILNTLVSSKYRSKSKKPVFWILSAVLVTVYFIAPLRITSESQGPYTMNSVSLVYDGGSHTDITLPEYDSRNYALVAEIQTESGLQVVTVTLNKLTVEKHSEDATAVLKDVQSSKAALYTNPNIFTTMLTSDNFPGLNDSQVQFVLNYMFNR